MCVFIRSILLWGPHFCAPPYLLSLYGWVCEIIFESLLGVLLSIYTFRFRTCSYYFYFPPDVA